MTFRLFNPFSEKNLSRYGYRKVPLKKLIKSSLLVFLPAVLILFSLFIYGKIGAIEVLYGSIVALLLSMAMVSPYIADLSSLTYYVEQLSLDIKPEAPTLSFLNNVEELNVAVSRLNSSWLLRKKQLEAAVEESNTLIDTLPDILLMLDPKFRIIRFNKSAESIFFWLKSGQYLHEIIPNQSIVKALEEVMIDHHKTGKTLEVPLFIPNRHEYIARIDIFPGYISGVSESHIALILSLRDVTELKRTEQTFADFVANASHEIRTPLTSIIGFIETLKTSAKNDEKAREEFLDIMSEQAERMSRLVTDLLSLSKIQINMQNLPTGNIDLIKIIKDVMKQLSWPAKEKKIELKLERETKLPKILGDEVQINQVFYNLISNAIKYSYPATTVTIKGEVTRQIPTEFQGHGYKEIIRISVEDQGEGIPPEHLPRLTERFYRVDTARSRKMGGTGLGLAIVKNILERHRGIMNIQSEVGKGSVFAVFFPVIQEKQDEKK